MMCVCVCVCVSSDGEWEVDKCNSITADCNMICRKPNNQEAIQSVSIKSLHKDFSIYDAKLSYVSFWITELTETELAGAQSGLTLAYYNID